jgi:hypothetical protein
MKKSRERLTQTTVMLMSIFVLIAFRGIFVFGQILGA